ncbi:hypothetical protein [Rhizomicrobium electricum]|uniref:Addiction module toxin RelE n=1 Tax=Rhizomicrobium electricum TaxID=480070 RepID=A0ABP3PMG2_9PROT|nr:hypothetical protein [Rhizomicrobium electricum]NIJ48757.1 hypothetical protein [Rhizomicrobium electricum]
MSAEDDFDPRWLGAHISEAEWHFHRQLLKRYGIVLGVGQFSKIVMDIRSGRATLIKATRGSRGLYMMHVKGAGLVYVLAVNGQPRTAWPVRHAKRLLKWARR